ncbi:hypothetical protein BDB01DRAFT_778589 [Pilobolus umbonatus]|nr:hypothetical protein BDB01DRAFT_778589 [Pilobolus umbonatus]
MIFSNFRSNPIQSLQLNITSGESIAFGPGSVINGEVRLSISKSVRAKCISVLFKCEEWIQNRISNTIFSIESPVWGKLNDDREQDIESGNHMYLFAIQMPSSVNYPPTIKDAYPGHKIEYTLQSYLHLPHDTAHSNIVQINYFPLVNCISNPSYRTKSIKIKRDSEYVDITTSLVNPSYCPGDTCNVRIHTDNKSSHNINQINIQLIATATSLHPTSTSQLPISSGPSYRHKQKELASELYYVSIPRDSSDILTICPFRIPSDCIPTIQTQYGQYIDISYELIITIPVMGSTLNNIHGVQSFLNKLQGNCPSYLLNPQVIRLQLPISTVPYSAITSQLNIPFIDPNNCRDIPRFISSAESPLPSPRSDNSFFLPGSPVETDEEERHDHLSPPSYIEDSSGYLMVPTFHAHS